MNERPDGSTEPPPGHEAGVLWAPSAERIERSALRAYLDWLERRESLRFADHDALWDWSVADLDRFWTSIVEYFGVEFSTGPTRIRTADPMPFTRWFPGATLNWAQRVLCRGAGDDVALVCVHEGDQTAHEIGFAELRHSVGAFSTWLRRQGVGVGDRIVAYLPNTEHAVIAALASAAVGAVWSCCSPDFGTDGTVGRLAQLEPTVLITVDGYHWNGRVVDRRDVVAQLRIDLPTVRHVITVPYVFPAPDTDTAVLWDDVLAEPGELTFEQVEFSHPLWVLFTSGTTGSPKGLVHGHGGITLENLKWSGLYCGVRPGERMFTYTSTGWALWNMQLGALTQGAGIVLYEGSPSHPSGAVWQVAARTRADVMLLGAAVVTASMHSEAAARHDLDLSHIRQVMVSGSALGAEGYHWLMRTIGPEVRIDSTSGGTDIAGSFVGSNEYSPVRVGRIGGRLAGVDCAAWDDNGAPVVGEVGELVVTAPMPSMPVHLWNDPDATRYLNTYFDMWPGVWRHGDWTTVHSDSVEIHGRSDATLNRHGVRLGSSDFYDVLDGIAAVSESLVVGVDTADGGYWLGIFVVPATGFDVTDTLRHQIADTLRDRLSPRHVPDEIVAAPAIPHTLNGKKLEVPVKKLLAGRSLEQAINLASVDDPDVVRWYARFASERRAVWNRRAAPR
ncbi:acetoacetate--CoA ligase [Gordonia polyisoprenivorans]|uniref:acetoacetate--CoA ligase n=1 Tax=Gordonia polyisoprenivorans TaxID=84595 RepID=UPI000B99E3FE|nr:acetoacetate--CoA ligase [Gordonia polyisoprenivorans]OZC29636.1 acetoacetate--CoA ligase [Gordonia polyisoprenivorans]